MTMLMMSLDAERLLTNAFDKTAESGVKKDEMICHLTHNCFLG